MNLKLPFYLFLSSALFMLMTESLWLAPLVVLFAALAIHDLLNDTPPAAELGVDFEEEENRLVYRLERFRKSLNH